MKALMMVAHPDDCIIFGLGIIHHRRSWDWTIAYLTYTADSARGKEISKFWHKRNVKTHWMGFSDDYRDIENNKISFDCVAAELSIASLARDYFVVVTHDKHGDYGHLHHRFVNQCVTQHHGNVITFSPLNKGTVSIDVPDDLYSVDEIPIHYTSVGEFISPVGRKNEYCVPEHLLL